MRFIYGFILLFANFVSEVSFANSLQVSSPFSLQKDRVTQVEVLLAQQLLDRVRQDHSLKWLTVFQKDQMKKDAEDALVLYSRILSRTKFSQEKFKVYFRMAYLHEVLDQTQEASEIYQKILSQSQNFAYSKIAYKKFDALKNSPSQNSTRVVSIHHVQKPKMKSILKTESNIIKARSHITSKEWESSLEYFRKACQTYTQSYPCVVESCDRFPSMIRSFLRVVGQKSSPDTLEKFQKVYLEYFPRDFLVKTQSVHEAVRAQKYEQAVHLYEKYILLEKEYIRRILNKDSEKKLGLKNLEPIFSLMQEIAHLSEDNDLKIRTYDFYLSHSSEREYEVKVAYLRSVALFNLGHYDNVAPIFRQISMSEKYETSIREQSAVYALESLVRLKQAHTARKWGVQFVYLFPNRKSDFKKIVPQL